MAEVKELTQEEYDVICSEYEKSYGYDSRSDEEKLHLIRNSMSIISWIRRLIADDDTTE